MSIRKEWGPLLERVARRLARDRVHVATDGPVSIHHFYCTSVMAVVRHLRHFTRARDTQAQHDVVKILFKYFIFKRQGTFETRHGINRLDIVLDDARLVVQVKTIVDITIKKLKAKAVMVVSLKNRHHVPADRLWVAFFYKFARNASPRPACKYILTLITLDLTGIDDVGALNELAGRMVSQGKKAVARKLGVNDELIIPVDNIMLVEDLERESAEKDALLEEKDVLIDQLEDSIADKEKALADKEKALADKEKALADTERERDALRGEIEALKRRLAGS